MDRNRKLARFNWYVLLACALTFAIGGTLFGVAAIVLSGHVFLWLPAILMNLGLYAAAFQSFFMMERC